MKQKRLISSFWVDYLDPFCWFLIRSGRKNCAMKQKRMITGRQGKELWIMVSMCAIPLNRLKPLKGCIKLSQAELNAPPAADSLVPILSNIEPEQMIVWFQNRRRDFNRVFFEGTGTCSRVGPMPGMKLCPDATGIIAISHGCTCVGKNLQPGWSRSHQGLWMFSTCYLLLTVEP